MAVPRQLNFKEFFCRAPKTLLHSRLRFFVSCDWSACSTRGSCVRSTFDNPRSALSPLRTSSPSSTAAVDMPPDSSRYKARASVDLSRAAQSRKPEH